MIAGEKIVLAIESAIAGGSLSLIRGDSEIGNWIGSADVSKAEEMLVNIDAMLTACSVSKHDLDLIAVSAGPGSFTGIRIGIATALGLRTGLDIPMSSFSALLAIYRTAGSLPAMVKKMDTQAGSLRSDAFTVAVPIGRNSVCIQSFAIGENEAKPMDKPTTIPESEVKQVAATTEKLIMHSVLFEKYSSLPNAADFGANIAYAVGRLASGSPGEVVEPLFISKSF
jgi:tRNA threonylcarbamoyl adenosine modification protein YeaZ